MPKNVTFADDILEALRDAKILGVTAQASRPKGGASWRFRQNLVLSAAIRVIASPKAMVNVVGVAGRGLTWAWRCWPGMRATAKDATGQGCVPLATELGYVRPADEPGGQRTRGGAGVYRDALRTL